MGFPGEPNYGHAKNRHRKKPLPLRAQRRCLASLEAFEDGAVVDAAALKAAGIVKNAKDGIKVLGEGELTKKLTVKAAKFSKSAAEKIEAVGGKAEVI